MLSKPADEVPDGEGWLYEPKWDGFRVLVFKDGDKLYLQSRDERPLDRYFPELAVLRERLPAACVLDGEIVIAGPGGLQFEALLQRIHPAASRVKMLAETTPAQLVVWDLLALGEEDLRQRPLAERKALLERELAGARPPLFVTPATRDVAVARDWFVRFEGAGLDGVIAKRLDGVYQPGKRSMLKIKHARTADCVVAGFRWYRKKGADPSTLGTEVGSLLLGLHDAEGVLHHVGIASGFSAVMRKQLVGELAPLREKALEGHPWAHWRELDSDAGGGVGGAEGGAGGSEQRKPGATSRWNRGKDLSWEPVRIERVCEVAYDHLQGSRFRHATHFQRWRPDRRPADCRYDQLEVSAPYELERIFGA
jgi:ATP-dependent DNA ligase